jgi:hypothetical protein
MRKIQISMDYYPEGDMFSITFGAPGVKGQGYELSEHIYIRIDATTQEPLGLTILSYSKLVALGAVRLTCWSELSPERQDLMRAILSHEPVNRFLQLKEDVATVTPVSTFPRLPLQEIVAA